MLYGPWGIFGEAGFSYLGIKHVLGQFFSVAWGPFFREWVLRSEFVVRGILRSCAGLRYGFCHNDGNIMERADAMEARVIYEARSSGLSA